MRNDLKKEFIVFSVSLFILLITFSIFVYMSTASSIQYQQKMKSHHLLEEEMKEHFVNNDGEIAISSEDASDGSEAPQLYFITDASDAHKIVKSSPYGKNVIQYIHQQLDLNQAYNHHYIEYENAHYYVTNKVVKSGNKTIGTIYTMIDSTEAYHGLKQLKYVLISLSLIYFFIILLMSYFFARTAVKPYEKAVSMQKRFVTDASHELKTPIAVLSAGVDVLKKYEDEHLSTIGKETLKDLSDELKEMNDMINRMLKMTNINEALQLSHVNLTDVVQESVEQFERLHPGSIDVKANEQAWINGNEGALKQVLYILFDNAYKYNDNVQISINIENEKNKVKLIFKDDGSGVDEKDLPNLFKHFYRGEKTDKEGQGIGLSLMSEILKQHRAQVNVRSHEGLAYEILFPNIK